MLTDRLDRDGESRQTCAVCGWVYYPHAAVSVAAILTDRGRVLLVQRKHEPYVGSWHLPSGFVSYGEHPFAAVEREMYEETGLSAKVNRLCAMFISEDDPREPGHLALFFEMAAKPSGTIQIDETEVLSIDWFEATNLPLIQLLNHKLAIESCLDESSGE